MDTDTQPLLSLCAFFWKSFTDIPLSHFERMKRYKSEQGILKLVFLTLFYTLSEDSCGRQPLRWGGSDSHPLIFMPLCNPLPFIWAEFTNSFLREPAKVMTCHFWDQVMRLQLQLLWGKPDATSGRIPSWCIIP